MQLWFSDARDFFESVRAAAQESEQMQNTLERMKAAESVKAQNYTQGGSGGSKDITGMAKVDTRIIFEDSISEALKDDLSLLELADAVVYGNDGFGGVKEDWCPQSYSCNIKLKPCPECGSKQHQYLTSEKFNSCAVRCADCYYTTRWATNWLDCCNEFGMELELSDD